MPKLLLNIWIACIVVGCLAGVPVRGANVLLRQQATHNGAVVYLGDVADISAATDAEVRDLVTTPLIAAPAPGTQQFLQAAQIRDLLVSRGVDVSTITIAGARTVEIGKAAENKNLLAVEPIPQPTPAESEQAAVAAITEYLQATTGHPDWQVELNLNAAENRDLAKLGLELQASAGHAPWTGTQRFQVVGMGSEKAIPVVARVSRLRYVVAAIRRIEQGNLIGAADVEIRLLGENVPANAVESLGQVVGKEALRAIDANAVLQASQLRAPLQVQRGETVKVFARTGGITVSTFAVVQQNGALGDLVQAQTINKKERFAARVSGWKQLEVLPAGVAAADIAAVNQLQTQQR